MNQSSKNFSKSSTDPLKLTAGAVTTRAFPCVLRRRGVARQLSDQDTTEGNCLLYRYCLSSDDEWATGSIPLAV